MATQPPSTPSPPAAIEADIRVQPGPHGAIELVISLTADDALDLALRMVGTVQAAKRAGRP